MIGFFGLDIIMIPKIGASRIGCIFLDNFSFAPRGANPFF